MTKLGDCYKAAASWVLLGDRGLAPPDPEAVLVHGMPTLTIPPFIPYGHAWVEFEIDGMWFVREVANGRDAIYPRHVYYEAGTIDPSECYRYSVSEARRMVSAYKHWGPWEGPEGCPPIEEGEEDEDE